MPPALWPALLYLAIFAMHLVVPARFVDGYVRDANGKPLGYRLNGLRVFLLVVLAWAGACKLGWLDWDALYVHRWEMAAGACAIGLLFSLGIMLGAAKVGNVAADFYLGRRENPQWKRPSGEILVDAKMYLYLAGAIGLELNVLSFAAHHVLTHPDHPSPGVALYAALFSFFVAEYLNFEDVHLYTYDFFAERVGFKLGWGCLVFYPFFYAVGLWSTADLPNPNWPPAAWVAIGLMFFCGWALSRGANLQKFWFKTNPDKKAFGVLAPVAVSDGDRRLLCSGFWALSRHVNYLGELLMAIALALATGHPSAIGPWLYPLYYVVLLFPREWQDDQRCAKKYGPLWEEYRRRVRWRIIPGVY